MNIKKLLHYIIYKGFLEIEASSLKKDYNYNYTISHLLHNLPYEILFSNSEEDFNNVLKELLEYADSDSIVWLNRVIDEFLESNKWYSFKIINNIFCLPINLWFPNIYYIKVSRFFIFQDFSSKLSVKLVKNKVETIN